MTQIENGWNTVLRQPGYFGKHREARYAEFDTQYGKGNWRIAWEIPGYTDSKALDFLGMCVLYEESYYVLLRDNSAILRQLVTDASDVYDDAPSNMASCFDYTVQETGRTHVQDISIRRVVLRLGETFRGAEPLQIRHKKAPHPLSVILSPGDVPFVRPELITSPQVEVWWWKKDSTEAFYQSNKVVQVRA
jgi:hypothetical protein